MVKRVQRNRPPDYKGALQGNCEGAGSKIYKVLIQWRKEFQKVGMVDSGGFYREFKWEEG